MGEFGLAQTIDGMASVISEYGILIIISVVFIVFTYKQNKTTSEQYQKMFNKLLESKDDNSEHSFKKEEKALAYEETVNKLLSEMLYSTDSGRAFFVRFHNGGNDLNKMSFLRMSMTNEIVRSGITPMLEDFKNQFRSVFNYPLSKIKESNEFFVKDIKDLKNEDYATYLFLYNRGVHRCYLTSIVNPNNKMVGVIGVEYLKENIDFDIEEMRRKVQETKLRIEAAAYVN